MSAVARWAGWLWHFVVGDDPWIALRVALALGLTAGLAALGVPAWWVMPVVIAVLLAISVRHQT